MRTSPTGSCSTCAGVPWDGSQGMKLTAPWDGHGMTATQSHGMAFEDFPADAIRLAGPLAPDLRDRRPVHRLAVHGRRDGHRRCCDGHRASAALASGGLAGAVRAGGVGPRRAGSVVDGAGLRGHAARGGVGRRAAAKGGAGQDRLGRAGRELSAADHAGSWAAAATARHSPFGFWFEDVRALGYLRPPWNLAFDALLASAFNSPGERVMKARRSPGLHHLTLRQQPCA